MDFSRYQPQASSSHYPNQGQQDAGTSRAVVPIDNNAVQQYITRLYHNPTLGIAPPTQDPAFFEKSQQDMISVKHKLEQMMLINQQQAELARLNTQRRQQAIASSSNVNAQAYQNAQAVNPAPQHHAGWTNAASGTWVQPQQVYIPPAQPAHSVAQTYTVHYPEVEMRDVPYVAQPSAQVVQIDTPPQKSAHYRPHTYNQPQEAPRPTQQRVNPAPVPQQTRVYRPQPQQAAPVQVANLNPTPGMFRPYPQHAPEAQRHPLQPSSQVGSPTVQQGQQVANMQKQMNYLQRLEQQHQRPPVQQPQASSSRALPVSQQVVVPMPAVARAANVTAHAQPVAPQPVVNKPPTPEAPVPSVEEVPPIPTASQESSGSTAGSATPNLSPPKPRSRRPFSLQDLRSERRRSNGRSSGTPSELRQVIAAPSATAPEATSASQGGSTVTFRRNNVVNLLAATPAGSGGTRPSTPRVHVQANTPPAATHPPEQSLLFSAPANATTVAMDSRTSTQEDAFTSAQTSSSTPLASANSLPTASIETVDPVPVPTATPDQAAIQIELPTPSAPPIVSPLPNASAPALNNPVPVQTGVTAHLGPRPAAPAPSALRPRPSSTGPMKMALEVLHQKGADCVALVRKAAQMSGASVDHLQVPSAGIGETRARAVPLFAPGQPLEIWSQKIQVSKELGEAIVHNIWALAKEKAIELGLDVKALKCSPAPTTLDAGSQQSADKPSIYGNSNTPVASGTPVDDLPAAPSLNQPSAPVPAQTAPALPTEPTSMQTSRNDPAQPTQQPPPALVAPNPAPTAPAVQQTAPALSTAPAPAPSAPPRMDVFRPTQFVQYQPAQASPTQSQVTNSTTNAPAPQGTNPLPSLARWGNYDPFPNGRPSPRTQPQPQLPPAAQSPAYVPPTLDFQPAPAPAPAPQPPAPISAPTPPPAKPKTKNTAALAYLRAIGAFRDGEPPVVVNGSGNKAGESDVVETSKKKDKGKGKATDVEIPMETEPASEPEPQAVPVEEAFDEEVIVDDTPTPPASVVVEESRASEPPQIPQDPIPRPDSPAAPEIAVLPEPVSAEPTRPSTPIAVTPTFVATPTPGPAPSSVAPILDMPMPDFAPSPTARIFPDPAPIPASVQAPVSPPRLPTPPPAIATPQPIVEPRVDASTPASTTSAIAEPPSAGYAPLKRKRKPADPATSANIPAPYPPTNTSWAAIYSNAHNSAHQVKRPRTTEPTSSKNKLTSKPTEPLFRPETPSADEDDEPAIIPTRRPKKLKRKRMIMEVVIPIRKDKGKAVAVLPSAVQSMIDLTLEDTDEELAQIVDEGSSDEEDSNLRMLRRRLRPHQCEWVGCVGSPILASAELLGIHLCKMHLRTRDPLTGHYMCRWDECKLKFKTSKRLWKHISEAHVVRPWYCPYQGCNRTASEKHRMGVHINRSHKEDSGSELRPLARPTEFLPEQVVLRPSAFPPGVPYFRIMSMALRYEVVPARISAARHSRIEPIILRNISARAELVDVPLPVEASPDRTRVPEPPAPIRSPLRLSTLPPEGLAEELEREAGPPPMSPIRSRLSPGKTKGRAISVHSDDSTPEPPPRSERVYRARGRGRGRGRGQIVRSVQHEASSSSSAAPRLQMVVELPSRK